MVESSPGRSTDTLLVGGATPYKHDSFNEMERKAGNKGTEAKNPIKHVSTPECDNRLPLTRFTT